MNEPRIDTGTRSRVRWQAHGPAAALETTQPPGFATGFPEGWSDLNREIESCRLCPLHATRHQVVIYRGSPRPRVLFVGEAPGRDEDRLGLPFVGRSGARLDAALRVLDLPPQEYGILNLVKCRPPENRFVELASRSCRPYLERQLTYLEPEWIVPLGAHALRAFAPEAPPITMAAGTARSWRGRMLFPLLHPAATLRSTRRRERFDRDLLALKRELSTASGAHPPRSPDSVVGPSAPIGVRVKHAHVGGSALRLHLRGSERLCN
ncbi:MAG: uracil-DNA glycosylase [Thermoplasmata archaeon]|nr:uracil-DNA glycosylase [Thermoplasmata archaeon]